MIDFHCHLDLYQDFPSVVERCSREMEFVLGVTTTPSAWEHEFTFCQRHSSIRIALGFHPELAQERQHELPLFSSLLPRADFVGEVGLDASPRWRSTLAVQQTVFRYVLGECQRQGGRVISIHSRGAATQVMDLMEEFPGCGISVLHWFSGNKSELERAIARGCYFSVGPAMLRSKKGQELGRCMPHNRVITETDGPFAEIGGHSLHPWQVGQAVELLASVWNIDSTSAQKRICDNLQALIGHFHKG